MRGVLHDVYVLRSRAIQTSSSSRRSQPYLKESLASMREAALIINKSSELLWCNDAAEYLLGVRFADEEGKRLSEILSHPSLATYVDANNFQKPLRIQRGAALEVCLQFEFSKFGADDRLVFVKDVTEQDRLERMRRDFVGNVSHELRTPLTVIKGYTETLQTLMPASDSTLQKSLSVMDTQLVRMESLVSDLLWLSSIESVEGERKEGQIDMETLLSDLVLELAAGWPSSVLDLQITTSQQILGDENELRSAISNLVVNALKYGENSPVVVKWIDTTVGPALLVEDKGRGIAAEHIPRLTERFYRVDKSRSLATGGTGLGLAIVKHVAVSHEAKLFVDSELGRGSCFRLVFPSSRVVTSANGTSDQR
jgi:two-component system phosphate regulon sensor histidine kinase PhoR